MDFQLCVVGSMLITRPYNFNALRHRMASLWQPCMGMAVEELGNRLLLFRFYHNLDLRWVLDNGPWLFDRHLLVLRELSTGMDPTTTPMHLADFWLQIHKLTPSFFTETVGRGLGNFVGKFVRYDVERNVYRSPSSYLRVRVTLDLQEERKRRRTAHEHAGDEEMTEVEQNAESPPKLLKGIQGRQKNLAPADLQDRFCPSE
ncbi:hypothetical protein LINGRAHAP2_LOCUS30612 [Linum grandiflorum]